MPMDGSSVAPVDSSPSHRRHYAMRTIRMKTVIASGAALTMALAVAACGGSGAPTKAATAPSSSSSNAKVRVGLSVPIVENPAYLPLVVAQQKGYFTKNHVDVKITAYKGGADAQAALAGGQEDIIDYTPAGVVEAVNKGFKEKMIAVTAEIVGELNVIVPANSKAKTFTDLNGGTIGVTSAGSLTDLSAQYLAKKYNISLKEIPLGSPGYIVALEAGHVSAGIGPYPSFYKALQQGKVRIVLNVAKAMPNNATDVVAASSSFIKSHPSAIRGYLAGWWEGVAWMKNNKSAAIKMIAQNENEPTSVATTLWTDSVDNIPTHGSFAGTAVKTALQIDGVNLSKIGSVANYEDSSFLP